MAFRITLALLLSIVLHGFVFYGVPQKLNDLPLTKGESYLVDILPGGQTKISSLPKISNSKEKTIGINHASESVENSASGNGTGSDVGVGNGDGAGAQADWMIEKPVYSNESRLNEEEGKVEVIVACRIDSGCTGSIKKSSGFKRLDQSVLRSVQKIKSSKDEIRELSFVFKLEE